MLSCDKPIREISLKMGDQANGKRRKRGGSAPTGWQEMYKGAG